MIEKIVVEFCDAELQKMIEEKLRQQSYEILKIIPCFVQTTISGKRGKRILFKGYQVEVKRRET